VSTKTAGRLLAAACVLAAMPLLFLILVNVFTLMFDCRFAPPGPASCQKWEFGTQIRVWLVHAGFGFVYIMPFAVLGVVSMAVVLLAKLSRSNASR
jgi:hypothetical protein